MEHEQGAWAHTLGPGFNTASTGQDFEGEPDSKSLAKMCEPSPDQLHWWYRTGVGSQSIEYFTCKWCRERISD